MVVRPQSTFLYRFGVFELDLRAAELRKNGVRLKLQDQPYQVLLKLLEHPGEIVSREELRATLWQEDTFVDFETGLNTAIKRLREAIGDSADHPTFIETVPRRGYKFIAPVGRTVGKEQSNETPGLASRQESSRGKGLRNGGWVAAAVALLLLASVAIGYRQPRPPTVTNTVRITNDLRAKDPLNPFVTDGLHLYFIEGLPWTTGSRIAQLSTTGGETTWISTALSQVLAIFSISPDGTELLVANDFSGGSDLTSELWVQPLPAGAPHRVGNMMVSAACWTPDGTHLVYAQGLAIMMMNQDGSQPHLLAKVSGVVRTLRFSPDGRRIRFYIIHDEGSSDSIWEMDADGNDLHPLFPDWKEAPVQCCGNWSPDGEYYYFQAGRGDAQDIWVMPERRSILGRAADGPSRLTSGPLRFSVPVPSGDGQKLFVVGSEPRVELFRYDLQVRRFDPYVPGLSAGPVDFSSDRKWMAYVSYPDMTLWRSRPDGSERIQLTFPPVRAYEPRWSPDGSKIAFMDVQFARPWKISLLSLSGGSPELLMPARTDQVEMDPTWTPDGKAIVFEGSDGAVNGTSAIYRLDLSTRKASTIPDSGGIFSPRMSPDGRYISALAGSQKKLMLFDTNTNRWSSLLEAPQISYNEWSHDGQYVYARENREGAGAVVRVRIKDRVPEPVVSLKDFPQLADVFAGWIGLTPDDEPLLMRNRSVEEIYALDLRFH
jgi:Tol biopolymer transport system component/DNA-binding winged helix-turn-helix (wHTH) protein